MKGEAPEAGASGIASVVEYERVLRSSMRLVRASTRANVVREIMASVDAQTQAHGGDFARAAASLDDPRWVGRQMVKVYGVAAWVTAAAVAIAALLALLSVPGLAAQPADSGLAIALALAAFGALVALVFWGSMALSARAGALAGGVGALARVAGFLVPQGDFAPFQTASPGEVSLFLLATALLLFVALVPLLAVRVSGTDAED